MPELPEATIIANQLRKEIQGWIVESVENFSSYRTEPEFFVFKKEVTGRKVSEVQRIAKTIVIKLDKEITDNKKVPSKNTTEKSLYLVIHLAMTGRLLLRSPEDRPDPWLRLSLLLSKGSPSKGTPYRTKELRFCDARMFGSVKLLTGEQLKAHQDRYGPDALDNTLTAKKFLELLKKKRTVIKRVLLDQGVIAGIGNIYANDCLWMARIHPETPGIRLTNLQAENLLDAIRLTLSESIEHRGSTLIDKMYVDIFGREGVHQNYFKVFGKGGQSCPRCQTIIQSSVIGGRGTFYCPNCQKKPDQTKLL